MSMLDKLKGLLKGHEDQASKGVDKAGDAVDDRTQGKHSGQVDTAQDKLKDQFGGGGDLQQPPQP
ncbi:antitoxin [Streptomyces sp. NPDC058001]|uniref:antitoxin n=1 Tax=Streptomyces sp. NPDC058001 TaxID=3346300 RepID=UPI0036EEF58D